MKSSFSSSSSSRKARTPLKWLFSSCLAILGTVGNIGFLNCRVLSAFLSNLTLQFPFPAGSRFCEQMGVELEQAQAEGNITDVEVQEFCTV